MASLLYPAAMYWLFSQTIATNFTQTRVSGRNPDDWGQVTIPQDGIYVVSVSVDANYGSSNQTTATVSVNHRYLYSAITRGVRTSAAMAFQLSQGDSITTNVTEEASNEPGNRLTVSFVDASSSSYYVARKATVPGNYTSSKEPIVLDMAWATSQWTKAHADAAFYQVPRSYLYWIMARSNPSQPHNDVDVRWKNGNESARLFVLRNSLRTAASCAGAFWLIAGAKVYMAPSDGPVSLDPFSLLSLMELRAHVPGYVRMAFTASPKLGNEETCRRTPFPPSWQIQYDFSSDTATSPVSIEVNPPPPGHRAHHRKTLDDPDNSHQNVFRLHWTGEVYTNFGNMASCSGQGITIQASGTYLLSMRPDNAEGDTMMSFAMHREKGAVMWVVRAENTPSGEVLAWWFKQGAKLVFYLHSSSTCVVGGSSLISLALSNTG